MVQVDPSRVVIGIGVVAFVFFLAGMLLGRRLARPAVPRELYNAIKELLMANSQALIAAVQAAESKIDGYAAVITASTAQIKAAAEALAQIKSEPTSDEIQHVIDELNSHLTGVDTAISSLNSLNVPTAPADGSVPQPNPSLPSTPAPATPAA